MGPMGRLAARWQRTIQGIGEPELQVSYARAELGRRSLGDVAHALDMLCQGAENGDPRGRDVFAAFVPTLVDRDHLPRLASLRVTAQAAKLMSLSRVLRASTEAGHHVDAVVEGRPGDIVQRADGKPLSLGERRAMARRPTRATLDRLLRDPHPMVASILLQNPRITEEDVIRMAAHRPANGPVVAEVAKRWSRRRRVRMAVVLNPGTPPGIGVPMLPLLMRPELQDVLRATDLPAVVRATASELHELRPPLEATRRPPVPH